MPELTGSWEHPDPEPPRSKPWATLLLGLVVAAIAVLIAIGPPPLAVGLGALVMLLLVWLLASPRASFEAAMERGLIPYVTLSYLRGRVLAWSGLVAVAFVLASWGTLTAATATWPGTFGPAGVQTDARTVLGFVGSSLLRVQYTLSIPDVFHLGESGIEQRPLLGSLLTFVLRAGLDLGVAAVIVAAMSIRRDVEGFSGLFSVPDTLGMRVEALRGGRYAYLLVMHYDLDVCGRLWRALDLARDSDTQEALAASGAFDWCAQHETLGPPLSAERLVAQAVVIEALSRRGWLDQAGEWASEVVDALGHNEWPAAAKAQVNARLAAVAALDGASDGAFGLIANAYEALLEDRDGASGEPLRTTVEAQAVWVRSVTRILGTLPPDALERDVTSELAERADEVVGLLVEHRLARFAVDALRLGTVRVPLVARTIGTATGLDMLTNVTDVARGLHRHHPWREVLLLNLVGAATALSAVAASRSEPSVSQAAADLEAALLEDLGQEDDDWDPRELTARAYDERLAEELAHSVGALSGSEPSGAAYSAAMRAADLFEARFESGVDEARSHAVEMRMFAVLTAFRVEAWPDVVTAAEHVYRLSDGTRPSPSDQHLLANTHAFHAQASRCVGDDATAARHAAAARALYDRVAASDWAESAAAIAEGRVYLEGL